MAPKQIQIKLKEKGKVLKKEAEMLKQTDEASKFRELIKAAPYGIFLIDLSGKIIASNESGAMRLGKTPEEIIGTTLREYFPSDVSKNRQKKGIEVIQSGNPISFEDQVGDRYYYNTISPVFNNQGNMEYLAVYGNDITDRKRSEDMLRGSETKYRAILEGIEEGYYETDLTGTFTFVSDKLCEMVNFSREELLYRENREFNTPETAKKIFDTFNNIYKTGKPAKIESFEFFTKEKEGIRKMYLELSVSLMKDPYGDPVGFRGIVRDGTERIKAEEALGESEEKYRLLADNISDNIWVLDLQSMKFSYISPSVIRITGYSVDESTGLRLRDVLTPPSMEIVKKAVNEELEKESQGADPMRSRMLELEQHHKNGTTIWTEVSIRLIRNAEGHPIEVLGVTRDITQRKKLETQLQHAQKMEAIGTLAGGIAHDFNNLLMSIVGKTSVMLHDLDADHPFYDQLKSIEQFIHSGSNTTKQLLGFARTGKFDVKPLDLNTLTANSIKMFMATKKEINIHEKYQNDVWTVEVDSNQIEQVLLNLFINAWQAMPKHQI
ncbi:MAG: PAS domain S-box protein [Deltaproteobacteria bacterium]|nr:PAS domain S-box protein [Deltaproteobacteria bacterium]